MLSSLRHVRAKQVLINIRNKAQLQNVLSFRKVKLKFLVNLTDYLDTGLFLDHRQMRLRIAQELVVSTS